MGHDLDGSSKGNSGIARNAAPINLFPARKLIVLIPFYIDTDRTIAVSGYQIQVSAPKTIIKTPRANGAQSVNENSPLDASKKGVGFFSQLEILEIKEAELD